MYPLVIITCGIFSNDQFKSKPNMYSVLSAAQADTATATPETTPIHQNVHHNPALRPSSSEQTLVNEPHPARNVPWMDSSKEYQPQRPPALEPRFQEGRLEEDKERSHGRGFWHYFCAGCCPGCSGQCLFSCLEITVWVWARQTPVLF